MIIRVENTAISNGISKSTMLLQESIEKEDEILDYGAGKLRNAYFLLSHGWKVAILDTKLQIERNSCKELGGFSQVYSGDKGLLEGYYNKVLCCFVLNVIPTHEERINVLKNIKSALVPQGLLFGEVRREKEILKSKTIEKFGDGYIVGGGNVKTFQKPFSKEDITELLKEVGFEILKIKSEADSFIFIAKKP